jgi:hypothetical protein
LPVDKENPGETFKVEAVLHMGSLDQPGEAFRIERQSFKGEYSLPDSQGKVPSEDDKTGEGDWINFPNKLETDINVENVLEAVKANVSVSARGTLLQSWNGFQYHQSILWC